jgi:hypothetical protein
MDKPRLDQGPDYERGFIDGMMYQTQSSVDKAVNAMTQPKQEPVAWWNDTGTHIDLNVSGRGIPLYTTPPQRTWVGLTDDEQRDIAYSDINCWDWGELMDAVEAKLKEKNT